MSVQRTFSKSPKRQQTAGKQGSKKAGGWWVEAYLRSQIASV